MISFGGLVLSISSAQITGSMIVVFFIDGFDVGTIKCFLSDFGKNFRKRNRYRFSKKYFILVSF